MRDDGAVRCVNSPRRDPLGRVGGRRQQIERWVDDLKRQFDVIGDEPLFPAEGRIRPDLLAEWAAEFGGKLRVSAPTVEVGDRMDALWTQLYGRLVKRQRRPSQVASVTSEPRPTASDERREVLSALEAEVRGWPNYDPELFRRDHIFRGGVADHIVDVAFRTVRSREWRTSSLSRMAKSLTSSGRGPC